MFMIREKDILKDALVFANGAPLRKNNESHTLPSYAPSSSEPEDWGSDQRVLRSSICKEPEEPEAGMDHLSAIEGWPELSAPGATYKE